MQLSIIIVSYNVKFFLQHCLYSLQTAITALEAEIIVVDNASSDGTMEDLLSRFPDVIVIDNPVNAGYAKANNQGLKQAGGEYILFLNPDTILPEDCLEVCLRFLQANPSAGACGVKMIDGQGRYLPESKRAFPSLSTSFYKLSGLTKMFPGSKRFARYYLGHLSINENCEVDVLSGAFFLVRKQVLEETGGFDEQFFMYGEDIDLSYRIQKAGYLNYYLSATTIIHFKGESTIKGTPDNTKLFYKAMSIFVNKHFSNRGFKSLNVFVEGSIWIRGGLSAAASAMLKRKPRDVSKDMLAIVAGNERDRIKAIAILKKQIQPTRQINELEPGNNLADKISLGVPDEIIFCTGSFSYKTVISLIQSLPEKISFKFYNEKSDSIIGSDSTISRGNVMT